jgi:hypothetical protein
VAYAWLPTLLRATVTIRNLGVTELQTSWTYSPGKSAYRTNQALLEMSGFPVYRPIAPPAGVNCLIRGFWGLM